MDQPRIDSAYKNPAGTFEMSFLLKDEVVMCVARGNMKSEDAEGVKSQYHQAFEQIGQRYLHLMDITSFDSADPEARQKMTRYALGAESPIARFAIVGGNFVIRTMFNLYGKVSKVPLKMFANQAEALAWLKAR